MTGLTKQCLTLLFISLALALAPATPTRAQDPQNKTVPANAAAVTLSYAPLVKKVAPAVVNIYSRIKVTRQLSPFMGDPFFEQFFGNSFGGGLSREQVENALGSGVIIDPGGLIVTNAHVVRNASEIKVALADGREFAARKVLVDTPSDLALLRIDQEGLVLPFATLAPSEALEVGDLVLAIGNPFGVGQTVTSGIVSAVGRSSLAINDYDFFIQTDAAINPGNSGGPLVAMDGTVIGINAAIFSRDGGSLGIGFAIPSEMVASIIAAEKSGQKGEGGVRRPWLGLTAQNVTRDLAENLGLKGNGVVISALHAASPGRKAGLKPGDIVTAINGHAVHDESELKFRMAMVPLGTAADFTVFRRAGTQTLKVEAMPAPETPPRDEKTLSGYHPLNGVRVANINPAVSTELNINAESGVVITSIDHASLRLAAAGDLVVAVNGRAVTAVAELEKALSARTGRGWQITFSRDGRRRQIIIR